MNERIKQLAEQANIGLFEDKSFGWNVIAGTDQHLSKFAELIVRECLSQVDNIRDSLEEDNEDQQALGADWAGLAIAQHFGVKE